MLPLVEEYVVGGRRLNLLARGRVVNLAAGEGHPAAVMDISFAIHALAVEELVARGDRLAPGVHPVPEAIDREVARLKLGVARRRDRRADRRAGGLPELVGVITGAALWRGRFELSEPPDSASYCHCTRCQKRTGRGVGAGADRAGHVPLDGGEEHVRAGPARPGLGQGLLRRVRHAALQPAAGRGAAARHPHAGVRSDPGVRPEFDSSSPTRRREPIPDDGLRASTRARRPQVSLDACVEKMEAEGLPAVAIETFADYYRQLEAGETG